MCAKLLKKSEPKRILIVSMTNIGDVVLTCPIIDILRRDFPQAKMDVVTGPKAVSLFGNNPNFDVKVFDKRSSLDQNWAWFLELYKYHYDCVVDLRHTALAFFLRPKYATPVIQISVFARSPRLKHSGVNCATKQSLPVHKKDVHLNRLSQVYAFDTLSEKQSSILTTKEDELFFETRVAPLLNGRSFVLMAPGAADSAKRWLPQGFAAVADYLSETHKVVFVGDDKDVDIVGEIQRNMKSSSISLAGKINLRQLAYVLKKCSWAITHDSGVMHLASYFNVPLVVLWGPTSLEKYAPWSQKSVIVRRNENCVRCQNPKLKKAHNCMTFIEIKDVIDAIIKIQQ